MAAPPSCGTLLTMACIVSGRDMAVLNTKFSTTIYEYVKLKVAGLAGLGLVNACVSACCVAKLSKLQCLDLKLELLQ